MGRGQAGRRASSQDQSATPHAPQTACHPVLVRRAESFRAVSPAALLARTLLHKAVDQ